ncbi:hypothetical protein BU16DRAFT_379093 [Lophium mytilinum]|uniref:Uncharacterized protein n=1 Tax=Lophium mytilinum TaxID=390894 RepID=A0A6A6QTL8_9PEZI|nr:hypothetical protein BU16DRAFT_379093 [Lophium mytilinum]
MHLREYKSLPGPSSSLLPKHHLPSSIHSIVSPHQALPSSIHSIVSPHQALPSSIHSTFPPLQDTMAIQCTAVDAFALTESRALAACFALFLLAYLPLIAAALIAAFRTPKKLIFLVAALAMVFYWL